jgi:hypothetical protein
MSMPVVPKAMVGRSELAEGVMERSCHLPCDSNYEPGGRYPTVIFVAASISLGSTSTTVS